MKKDIIPPVVKNVYVAVVSEENELGGNEWTAYLINDSNEKLEGVLVSSRGYGEIKGEQKKTATFRHSLEEMEAKSFKKIETIPDELLILSNEFWLSYYLHSKMYDKKYIFLPEAVSVFNSINIPIINKLGVMI